MSLEEFLELIQKSNPYELVKECVHRDFIYAITDPHRYKSYLDRIKQDYPAAAQVSIMGSANWGYSLNPKKSFGLFHNGSDIDIAIICHESFNRVWEELRTYHRKNYYLLDAELKKRLKRNGENVYSGFISPKWIPDRRSILRLAYDVNSNKYSDIDVGYRPVNMMYFKNLDEVIDYYVRGFTLAKNRE